MSRARTPLVLALVAALALAATLAAYVATRDGRDGTDAAPPTVGASGPDDGAEARAPLAAPPPASEPTPAPAPPAPTPERAVVEPTEPPAPPLEPSPYDDVRAGRVAGRLLDVDGTPAADVALTVRASLLGIAGDDESKWLRERVETDANGLFETEELFPAGIVRVRARRGSERLALADDDHDHLARRARCDWTLRILADVEFRLRITGAGEIVPSRWRARIVHDDEDGDEQPWSWRGLDALESDDDDEVALRYLRSDVGEPPFVDPRVEVESEDGVWRGKAPVAHAAPREPLDVVVAVERVGAVLAGTVVTAEGAPIPDATVAYARLDGDDEEPLGSRSSDWSDGSFRLEHCLPGRHRVTVTIDDLQVFSVHVFAPVDADSSVFAVAPRRERVVRAEPGVNELEPFVFDEVVGGIDGLLLCADGSVPPCTVRLHAAGAPAAETWSARVDRNDRFAFGPLLPRGEYELTVEPAWPGAFEPVTRTVVPPSDELVVAIPDCTSFREVSLVAHDAASGEPLRGDVATLVVASGSHWRTKRRPVYGNPLVVDVPDEPDFVWSLSATGYRPTSGGAADLPPSGARSVPLEPGWGALVRLRRASSTSASPSSSHVTTPPDPTLEGIALHADGAFVAETDATGTALVSLDARPDSLTVPGWRIVSTDDAVSAVADGEVLLVE